MTSTQTIALPDSCQRIALCGGPYSNFGAVEAFLAQTEDYDLRFCLGDIGGFGPEPNRTLTLLREAEVICLQGNYDHAIGHGERDCGCGYSDERDRQFAQISYDYTYAHTDPSHRDWLRQLPQLIRLSWEDAANPNGQHSILLCHGSPDQTNAFVWESETGDDWLRDCLGRSQVEIICATHSGIPWVRSVALSPGQQGHWFNVGVLGRPAHEPSSAVYYGSLELDGAGGIQPRLHPLTYDIAPVVEAMAQAGLPVEFRESLTTGEWTTCAEVLPATERRFQKR